MGISKSVFSHFDIFENKKYTKLCESEFLVETDEVENHFLIREKSSFPVIAKVLLFLILIILASTSASINRMAYLKKMTSISLLLFLAANENLHIEGNDVSNAHLYGDLGITIISDDELY